MKRSEILCVGGWLLMVVFVASSRTSAIARSGETNRREEMPQSRIVFSKGNVGIQGIKVMNPDGTDMVQLTTEEYDMQPKWSPDRNLITFLTMREEDLEVLGKYPLCMHFALYIMDSSGGGQRRISDVPVMDIYWSPDSKSIAFISGYEDSENFGKDGILSSAVYVVDVQSKKIRRLTAVEGKLSIGLSWSPSANQIAYSKQVARRVYDIFTVNADGSGSRRIANGTDPIWSPDGKRIFFVLHDKQIPNKTTGIHVIDIDGEHQQEVSTAPGYVRLVGFSPDGKKILYSSYDKSINSLYVMDTDGSDTINVSMKPFKVIDMPQFIDNGSRLFFAGRIDKGWDFFSVGIDGSSFKNITGNP